MKSFIKLLVLFCFTLNNANLYAGEFAEKCQSAKDKEVGLCRTGIETVKVSSEADALKSVARVSADESAQVTGQESYKNNLTQTGRISGALDACLANAQAFVNKCHKITTEAKAKLDSATAEQKPIYQADLEQIAMVEQKGKAEFSNIMGELKASGTEAALATQRAQDSLSKMNGSSGGGMFDDFSWKDAGKLGAIAGLVGVAGLGAMSLLGGGSDSQGNSSQTSGTGMAGGTGGGTTTPTTPTVDCTNLTVAAASASCDATTVTTCSPTNMITTTDCQTFSSRYCGLGGTGTGAGTGSSYCRAAMAYSFCATTGREQCASCVQVAQWASPACAANPAEDCKAQFTKAQLVSLRDTVAACGSDPINAELDLWVDPNPLLPEPVLPTSIVTASVAGRNPSAQSAIRPAYGTGLLKSNSDALLKMCKSNQLVNCNVN